MDETNSHKIKAEIPTYAWNYALDLKLRNESVREIKNFLGDAAREVSVNPHIVDARSKDINSFYKKSIKKLEDGSPRYPSPFNDIQDSVAARVILYTTKDREILVTQIEKLCSVIELSNPGEQKNNGYDSIHIIINGILADTSNITDADNPKHFPSLYQYFNAYGGLEIQLRTVASHAWAEYEHDIRYKSRLYADLPQNKQSKIDQLLIEAGGFRKYMDKNFEEIQNILEPDDSTRGEVPSDDSDDIEISTQNDEELNLESIEKYILTRYPQSFGHKDKEVFNILQQLENLDIKSIAELDRALANVDSELVESYMEYYDTVPASRRLDDDLLTALEEKYIDAESDTYRKSILELRLRKVRGKFAIYQYQIDAGEKSQPRTAARLIREISRTLASYIPIEQLEIEDVIHSSTADFSPGAKEIEVKTPSGVLYIRTNLSRYWSEQIMKKLITIAKDREINLHVYRYGDLMIEG